jgi:hypothetical protein
MDLLQILGCMFQAAEVFVASVPSDVVFAANAPHNQRGSGADTLYSITMHPNG